MILGKSCQPVTNNDLASQRGSVIAVQMYIGLIYQTYEQAAGSWNETRVELFCSSTQSDVLP